MKLLENTGLSHLVRRLAERYEVLGPVEEKGRLALRRLGAPGGPPPAWNAFRLAEPLKSVWFPARRVVARWGSDRPSPGRPRAVFGAKACDLKAIACLDRVLRDHDYREPGWCEARERTLILSGDCTSCADTCFCTMLGDRPHPTSLFDLNFSPVDGGFLVEVGSERGQSLVEADAALFRDADPAVVARRDAAREEVARRVRAQNERFPVRDAFERSVGKHERTRIWGDLAATCVECHACNLVCPTCHCFLLHDARTPSGAERSTLWDSCFHAGHARMAGGLTPRLQLTERFRNHYWHKFVSFPRNWGITACSGCGRCIEACMGRIDKRQCLHRLETQWIPSEVLKEVE